MPPVKLRDQGRIQRLVTLSYMLSMKSEIHMEELIERLGVSRKSIEDDLNLLMFIGLPPYSPGELFDIYVEDDFVSLNFNEVFLSPLRLSDSEKTQALVALKKLLVQSKRDEQIKIEEIISIIDSRNGTTIDVTSQDVGKIEIIQKSIEIQCPLEIQYFSLNSASISTRVIEPKRIFTTASLSYIYAYCQLVDDYRVFRSDRIISVELKEDYPLTETVKDPTGEVEDKEDLPDQYFESDTQLYADLWVGENCDWVLDTYPHEIINATKRIFRFYTPSPFFIARLIGANVTNMRYIGGTIERGSIVQALSSISQQMNQLLD